MATRGTGWRAVVEWGTALGLVFLGVLTMSSIGVFMSPLAFAACWLAARRNRSWPEGPIGGAIGTGFVSLLFAFLNRRSVPCLHGSITLGRGQNSSCGGFDPIPWLLFGTALVAVGITSYVLVRRGFGNRTDSMHPRRAT